ncbi:MAG: putative glycogen synthase, partial [Phycisphaerales bacterium]|nr:putative glycogen synthase [Phycisphaerales bacterium]
MSVQAAHTTKRDVPSTPARSPRKRDDRVPMPPDFAPRNGAPGHDGQSAGPPPIDYSTKPPLFFECGWEVCWQLGGIYTVLRTKARAMQERWGDRYVLVGPYNPGTAAGEFEELPTEGLIRETLDALRGQGIPCHYGRWLVPGRPRVILLDYRAAFNRLGEYKYMMSVDHHIATGDEGEVNDTVAFGFILTEFFRLLCEKAPGQKILAHFHEWMAGVALPRIAHAQLPITTVFTTHATLLGRYLAGDNPSFYDHLAYFNADAEAAKYQILPKHLIEKAATHSCTVFTTVSEITGVEATSLLGRRPDVIVPNGLDIKRFEAPHEFQHQHNAIKNALHKFTIGHFFPSYSFDLDRTLYFFTSGRYEYKNKGIDVYIEALYRLNQRLKQIDNPPTIVSFIITKAPVKNINVDALSGQARMAELENFCKNMQENIGRRIFMASATGRELQRGDLIDEEAQIALKRFTHAMRTYRQPLVVTHDLWDDGTDPTLAHIRHRNLLNAADDPVKVVFHPQFVTATSPLIGLDYDAFVRGCHMGIFPSYYEPWG